MDTNYLRQKHDAGLAYTDYVATGKPQQTEGWQQIYDRIVLTDAQQALLGDFCRDMKVIVVSGIWCGDCVRQGPMLQKIADACGTSKGGKCDLVWLDRDEHIDLQEQVKINAGNRVPVAIFMAEDDELVAWYGDKTLSRYRFAAAAALGAHCPLPGAPVPDHELEAEIQDWIDQFERVHLLLRVSGRLREKHSD